MGADKPLVLAVADAYAPSVTGEGALVAGSLPGARLLSGHDATAEAFLRAAPGAGLIHVACHGVHAASNPLFSRLRLADRWITSTEIMRLRLEASLVTLSACESGVHGPAIEPVGLGWAFLAAGAAGVLVSQWIVHDEAAPTLMAALYAELAAGASVPEALRTAQLLTAESYPHPFSWASFSYVANPSVNLSTSKK